MEMVNLGKLNTDVLNIINTGTYWGSVRYIIEKVHEDCIEEFEKTLAEISCEYVCDVLNELSDEVGVIKVGNPKSWTPQYYNYTDDCVEFDFSIEEKFFTDIAPRYANNEDFLKHLKETYYSCSGYMNLMPNNKEKFSKEVQDRSWKPVAQIINYVLDLKEKKGEIKRKDIQSDFFYDVMETCDNELLFEEYYEDEDC